MTYPYRYFGAFRLLLALLVVWQHFGANMAPLAFAQAMHGYATGSVAVLVFFCLSGFVIAEAADVCYRDRSGAFFANRLLRIVPHFICAVMLSVALQRVLLSHGSLQTERGSVRMGAGIFSPGNLLANFAGIIPGMERFYSYDFIPIAWAVRIEMAFYCVMTACLYAACILRKPFERVITVALLLLLPCFVLSQYGKLLHLFGFVPYFSYGAGLYYAHKGKRTGEWIAFLSLPAMAWYFFRAPDYFALHGGVNFALLAALIAGMTWLVRVKFSAYHHADALAGQWTYPLYMYHYIVMVIIASLAGRSYAAFVLGMMESLLIAGVMTWIVDTKVDRVRKHLREGKIGDGFFARREGAG